MPLKIPKPSKAPDTGGMLGGLSFGGPFGQMDDPIGPSQGKSIARQQMNGLMGMRGSGSRLTGGDPLAHGMNHYKKGGLAGLVGGSLDERGFRGPK